MLDTLHPFFFFINVIVFFFSLSLSTIDLGHCRGDNGWCGVVAAVTHYRNRYVDAAAAIQSWSVPSLCENERLFARCPMCREPPRSAREDFCTKKKEETSLVAGNSRASQRGGGTNRCVFFLKSTNSLKFTFYVVCPLNDSIPVLGVFEQKE